MKKALITIVFGTLGALNLFAESQSIEELERNLSEASGQIEMNIVSGKIGTFWDDELKIIEEKIEVTLSDERRDLFMVTSEIWRSYRSAQTIYEASESRGGTIMPLITNLAFTEITKQRIRHLVQSEGLEYTKLEQVGVGQ